MTTDGIVVTVSDTFDIRPFPLDVGNDGGANDSIQSRLADTVRQEERRRRLAEFLSRDTPAWNPDDHPEIDAAGGAAEWVRKLRHEAERSFQRKVINKDQE